MALTMQRSSTKRREVLPLDQRQHGAGRFAGQLGTHALGGVDEGRARHVQAHGFEQHLVAVGRAIKSASAFAVVSLGFGFQQLGATHLPQCGFLAHLGLFTVGQTADHGACGHKHRGQMAKLQSANQEAGHDLVAHTQHQGRVKHIVAERHRRGHGDHVAAEQAQFHAGGALGHAVTHGGHAARHLGGGAQLAGFVLDQVGVVLQRRVGRQQVVVGIDDADIRGTRGHHLDFVECGGAAFVAFGHGGKGVGHVGAAQALGTGVFAGGCIDLLQIGLSGRTAALSDAGGHSDQYGVEGHVLTSGQTW
jgi:hypothetical protein